ncbi:unnamed protein product, partial [Brassica napus]
WQTPGSLGTVTPFCLRCFAPLMKTPDPFPPDPPDPDPDNPLSLSRFPPLNSPASRSPKTFRSLLQTPPRSSVSKVLSSSQTAAASAKANPNSSAVPSFSRSTGIVQFDSQNFKILPPKSPIQTNRASKLSPFPPPLNPLPKSPIPPSNQNPNCSSSTAKTPILNPNPNFCSSSATHHPPPPLNVQPPPPYPKTHNSTSTPPVDPPPLVERIRKSQDKSLSRQAPPSFSDSGRPRVLIPDSVFQKGAELHRDFIICYFNGRPPPFNHIQSVLNHLWGKGRRVEIHTNPLSRSMLVRIPSDYLRQKILEKRVWYVGDSMFQAVQWTSSASPSSPPLDSIQIWAHLTGIPLDLRHQQGLSLVAGLVGEPKETDDFTLNLVSLTLSHVKVEVDLTIPLPSVVEFTRESGEVVEVSVAYPWVPPTCSHCKELGHIMKNCLQVPLPAKPAVSTSKPKGKKSSNVNMDPTDKATDKGKSAPTNDPKDSAKSPGPSTSHEVPVSLAPPAASLSPQGSSAPSPLSQPPPVPIPVTQTTLRTLNSKISSQLVPYNHSPPSSSPDSYTKPPLKRPRPGHSSQVFSSFTDQLNFFAQTPQPSKAPAAFPLHLNLSSNPFSILVPHDPLHPEEVID